MLTIFYDSAEALDRRKIRLIESNANRRYLKKFTCKRTLQQVFYLSKAPSPPMTPPRIPPPLHNVYVYTDTNSRSEKTRVFSRKPCIKMSFKIPSLDTRHILMKIFGLTTVDNTID
jgi:hypothetical protein